MLRDLTMMEIEAAISRLDGTTWAEIELSAATAEFFSDTGEIWDLEEVPSSGRPTVELLFDWDNNLLVERFGK